MKHFTKSDIIAGLKKLGLTSGDHVIVHSALSSLGLVEGGADTVIDALLETVGAEGTVVFPTFSNTGVFDINKSVTGLGVIPETARRRRQGIRSLHPLASVVAFGKKAAALTKNHDKARTAHGDDTPYTRLCELGGKILLLGVDQDRNTFLHTAEALARLPYLKTRSAPYHDMNGKEVTGKWAYFPGPHRNFIGLQRIFEEEGLTCKGKIGSAVSQVMAMRPLLSFLLNALEVNPGLFISANPNLPDGVSQLAAIKKHKLGKQSFQTAGDSAYSGRYTEEMIENLQRCGISHVVLSHINGQAWNALDESVRKWHLQGFRSAGIHVAGLRLRHCPSDVKELLKQAGTERLIVPSTLGPGVLKELAQNKIAVDIENICMSGDRMSQFLVDSCKEYLGIGAAFNPLEYAMMGELPFLQTYKKKVRRSIRSLIINDGLATGERTGLEQGRSEIKELISILSCGSFDGLFILESECPDCFCETAEKFFLILEELGL